MLKPFNGLKTNMGFQGFSTDFYEFFIELTHNNHKTWFDENRATYEKVVKPEFYSFLEELLSGMKKVNPVFEDITDIKSCIFRINKDIRFSKDKSPYKTFCSAALQIGGRKKMFPGGLYIEIGPENCALYSGIYMPEKEDLYKIRQSIAMNLEAFGKAISMPKFVKNFGQVRGEKNKVLPAEFKDAVSKQELILNKQFYVVHTFEPEESMKPNFVNTCVGIWDSCSEFNRILALNL